MRLELSTEEAEALKDVLDEKLVNLAREINRTDHLDLKNALKARERALDHIVSSLSAVRETDLRPRL
jgi:hypothetical protein